MKITNFFRGYTRLEDQEVKEIKSLEKRIGSVVSKMFRAEGNIFARMWGNLKSAGTRIWGFITRGNSLSPEQKVKNAATDIIKMAYQSGESSVSDIEFRNTVDRLASEIKQVQSKIESPVNEAVNALYEVLEPTVERLQGGVEYLRASFVDLDPRMRSETDQSLEEMLRKSQESLERFNDELSAYSAKSKQNALDIQDLDDQIMKEFSQQPLLNQLTEKKIRKLISDLNKGLKKIDGEEREHRLEIINKLKNRLGLMKADRLNNQLISVARESIHSQEKEIQRLGMIIQQRRFMSLVAQYETLKSNVEARMSDQSSLMESRLEALEKRQRKIMQDMASASKQISKDKEIEFQLWQELQQLQQEGLKLDIPVQVGFSLTGGGVTFVVEGAEDKVQDSGSNEKLAKLAEERDLILSKQAKLNAELRKLESELSFSNLDEEIRSVADRLALQTSLIDRANERIHDIIFNRLNSLIEEHPKKAGLMAALRALYIDNNVDSVERANGIRLALQHQANKDRRIANLAGELNALFFERQERMGAILTKEQSESARVLTAGVRSLRAELQQLKKKKEEEDSIRIRAEAIKKEILHCITELRRIEKPIQSLLKSLQMEESKALRNELKDSIESVQKRLNALSKTIPEVEASLADLREVSSNLEREIQSIKLDLSNKVYSSDPELAKEIERLAGVRAEIHSYPSVVVAKFFDSTEAFGA